MSVPRPVITGALQGDIYLNKPAPNRLEFREFVKDRRQFSLYIQALQRMQDNNFSNDFSFAAIGGIHGYPFVQWGDSGNPTPPTDPDHFGGYCTHGSVVFPTWHRPYVALFEQELNRQANEVVKLYHVPDLEEWLTVARNIRSPFWDWAHVPESNSVPVEITLPEVDIIGPDGAPKRTWNPLYSYHFKPEDLYDTFPLPFSQWTQTLKHPTDSGPDAQSDMKALNQTYADNSSQMRTKTYRCLTTLTDWEHFSNHTTVQEPGMADSLETLHDTMHYEIGGLAGVYGPATGHMGDPTVAGLEPAFYLHHTNVDRLLELWSALNQDVWVVPGEQPGGTWTVPVDGILDVNSDLTPFWNSQSSYWKSSELRDPTIFNYSYPEFNDLYTLPAPERRRKLIEKIKELYAPGWQVPSKHQGPDYREWSLHIKFKKYQLGAPFTVLVYLGDVYVGTVTAFVPGRETKCANCRRNVGTEIEGFVFLNEVLFREYQDLPSTKNEDVLPILKDLKFKLAGSKPDGTLLDIADLTSLKIAPVCYSYQEGAKDELPTLGEPEYHWGVLEGKPGNTPAEKWAL